MNKERISVIIPTCNNEDSIEKCLKSVLNQSYQNLDVIVINDGSTDKTDEVLEKYKDRVQIYKKQNEGVASARNLGLEKCNTKYLFFVDADDYLEEDAIEILYNKLIETNSDMVIGNIEDSSAKDITIKDDKYEYIFNQKIKYFMVQWNKLMKKELFDGLKYPDVHIAEDEYMIYHILERTNKITFVSKKTYNYCDNPNGITSKRLNYYQEILNVFKDRYVFFENTKYKEIFYKLYMNYYIYLYCQFKDNNITKKEIVTEFRKELKNNGNMKYMCFYIFPNLYYKVFKIRRRICKKRYQ